MLWESGIRLLEIAPGIKELLTRAGLTVEYISLEGPSVLSSTLGIDRYVAKIICEEAKKVTADRYVIAP